MDASIASLNGNGSEEVRDYKIHVSTKYFPSLLLRFEQKLQAQASSSETLSY
jgi:hypothetical protein